MLGRERRSDVAMRRLQPRAGVAKMPSDGEALFVTESRRSRLVGKLSMLQLPIYQLQTNFNPLPGLNWGSQFFNFSQELAWLAVGLLAIVFVFLSFILFYHWKKFGFEKMVMAKAALLYSSVSAALLLITMISLLIYLYSL